MGLLERSKIYEKNYLLIRVTISVISCTDKLESINEINTLLNTTKSNADFNSTFESSIQVVSEADLYSDYTENIVEISEDITNDHDDSDVVSVTYEEYIENLKYTDETESKISIAGNTVELLEAIDHALQVWDSELNKIYSLLIHKLSKEEMDNLRTEERLWIK